MRLKEKIDTVSQNELPETLFPRISFCSNRLANIEGCKGVIEYDGDKVRLNCRSLIIKFTGTELSIKSQTENEITISGNILTMEFCGC